MSDQAVRFVLYGQAQSKANSRRAVTIKGEPRFIKSKAAIAFLESARRQVPPRCRLRLEGPVCVTLRLFYRTELPDLDESLVLDAMQDLWKTHTRNGVRERVLVQAGVYRNDRQVREKHVYHGIDAGAPRVEVQVEPLRSQVALPLPPAAPLLDPDDPF